AVLIGDIAVDVGMFSPEVILYVAISTIGTYVTPSYEMGVANKFIKYFILLMTIFFGLNGFAIGTTLAIIYLIRLQALETPYFCRSFLSMEKQCCYLLHVYHCRKWNIVQVLFIQEIVLDNKIRKSHDCKKFYAFVL